MEEEEIYKAIAFFKSAIADETCCSLAHAGLADAYCRLALLGSLHSPAIATAARYSAELAVTKDPELAEAHVSAGWVTLLFDLNWTGAQASVTRALALDSHSASARVLRSVLLCISDRADAAVEICREAVALDPLSFPANLALAVCLLAACRFESAIDHCWKILTLSPRFAPAQIVLALAYEQLEMQEEAAIEFKNAQRCAGSRAAAVFRRCLRRSMLRNLKLWPRALQFSP
jgi:tetratricopeptide (TPR) repeat protein